MGLKMGYSDIPWFILTKLTIYVYNILTLLVCFHRSDFINLSICVLSLFIIENTDEVKRKTFRNLLFCVIGSLFYDLIWMLIYTYDWNNDTAIYDGGAEVKIRRFSLSVTYISFFFRLFVILVYWKASMDFEKVIINHDKEEIY